MPNLRKDYVQTGKVKVVFKNYPLGFHEYAQKAAEEKLPKEILWRKKQGFGVPAERWIKGEMKDYVMQRMEGKFLQKEFKKEELNKLVHNLKHGKLNAQQSKMIWSLFALEEWHEQYLRESG